MFFKIFVLKQAIKKQQLYIVKDTKFFDFQFLIPATYNTAKYVFSIFVAITIAVFCVQLVKQLFLHICKEVPGAFSGMAYFLLNSIRCDLVLLFQKINSLQASISLFTNQNVLVFTYKQTRSPRIFFNLIFNVIFYTALCKSLCIFNVPAVFFIKCVLTNFAKFTENT